MKLSQLHILLTLFTVKIRHSNKSYNRKHKKNITQWTITCTKLTIEILEQRCEICSKLTIKTPKRRRWAHNFVSLRTIESSILSLLPCA